MRKPRRSHEWRGFFVAVNLNAVKRPNILLILTDQQRHDCLGCAGQAQLQTPHLDALAADSAHFANAFCTYPVCTPSRYSLLSGLPARGHAGWTNYCTLAPHIPTFPKSLRAAGYRTAAVGKMHFAPTYLNVGFDQMELCEQDGDGRFDDDYHRDLRAQGRLDCVDIMDQRAEFRAQAPREYWETCGAMPSDLPEAWHSTTWIADRALRQMESWDASGGNLLMCGFVKPHHPFDPPAPWDAMYDPDEIELLPGWTETLSEFDARFPGYFPNAELTPDKMRRVTAYYFATISQIDFHVGRMMETLKSRRIYDDTIIVFASDHGEYLGFHHLLLKSGPMYDPLVRVPLLIKFADNARGGTRDETLVSLLDVAPTLLRAAALESPPTMKGRDLATTAATPSFVFAEDKVGQIVMARSERYKLLWSPDATRRQFFDLEDDPLELNDCLQAANLAVEVARHRAALANWALFEALPPTCLLNDAPTTLSDIQSRERQENREAHRAYSADKFADYRAGK